MFVSNLKEIDDRNVLVVEDDPEINQLVGAYVELAGFNYVSALNGIEALAQARECFPSAVVLDLMLPDLSGLEICRQLKADWSTCGIPVIILTALDSDDSRLESLRCGAAVYLTKPFDPDEFLDVLCRLAIGRADREAQVAAGDTAIEARRPGARNPNQTQMPE
ncbi:MAG TPA: response regulator [Tepidisphaeraceae bacterium]|jgi:DNA-binding response OmpR family regulator|nr:response regulator [Tepidisphaeraceae bacterium]